MLELKTYLPYPNVIQSAMCLDNETKEKQRKECRQLLLLLEEIDLRSDLHCKSIAHYNDFYVQFWKGSTSLLKVYFEFLKPEQQIDSLTIRIISSNKKPKLFGNKLFHQQHQEELKRINPEYYNKVFV